VAEPSLSCPDTESDTGAYRIAWSSDGSKVVRIEENGTLLYEGTENATTVSGRPKGEYIYRIGQVERGGQTVWANTCRVVVSPPSLTLAMSLFATGLIVFASVLLVVVRGHRAHQRGELGTTAESR
jgi:hypothetical protein